MSSSSSASTSPIILSTWSFGQAANRAGWPHLQRPTASAMDAVIAACESAENDLAVDSVGKGGLPDASGRVSLDGCVMESPARCGGVCYLTRHNSAAAIARAVMEKTNHKLLAGEGADHFADAMGFPEDRGLLTANAQQAWEAWAKDPKQFATLDRYKGWIPPSNSEELYARKGQHENEPHNRHHDTIGVLAMDAAGRMAGGCTTSGMAFKVPGRVGDSPIIGHGLYVEPEVGACTATGTGELIMGVCGSFLAVELMRRGLPPLEALRDVITRIMQSYEIRSEHQAAFIALRADGAWAGAALRPGFRTAVKTSTRDDLVDAEWVGIEEGRKRSGGGL